MVIEIFLCQSMRWRILRGVIYSLHGTPTNARLLINDLTCLRGSLAVACTAGAAYLF